MPKETIIKLKEKGYHYKNDGLDGLRLMEECEHHFHYFMLNKMLVMADGKAHDMTQIDKFEEYAADLWLRLH